MGVEKGEGKRKVGMKGWRQRKGRWGGGKAYKLDSKHAHIYTISCKPLHVVHAHTLTHSLFYPFLR